MPRIRGEAALDMNRPRRRESHQLATYSFEIGIRTATGFIEPTGIDISLDATIPSVRQIFLEPPREHSKFLIPQMGYGRSQFGGAHGAPPRSAAPLTLPSPG